MMHDYEKSDPSIVARNQANKAASAVAERGERRDGAKGNAEQPDTLRTQGRDGVPHGMGRVHKAARQDKRVQFTALLHHMMPELGRNPHGGSSYPSRMADCARSALHRWKTRSSSGR